MHFSIRRTDPLLLEAFYVPVYCYHISYHNYFVILKLLYSNQKPKVEVIFTKFTNSYNKSEKVLTHHDNFQLKRSVLQESYQG
jgi:hypothetical protein